MHDSKPDSDFSEPPHSHYVIKFDDVMFISLLYHALVPPWRRNSAKVLVEDRTCAAAGSKLLLAGNNADKEKFMTLRSPFQTLAAAVTAAVLCGGCSSFSSRPIHASESVEGLVYFLPKKDVQVTLTVLGGKVTAVTMAATAAYPDRAAAFELTHASSGLANTATTFEIRNGLLSSTNGTTTSGVADALKNLAASSAQIGGTRNAAEGTEAKTCGSDGNHVFRVSSATSSEEFCGVKITIDRLTPVAPLASTRTENENSGRPGVYYRQVEGLLVVAKGQGLDVASIVYVPADTTYFLPAGRSFFANGVAEISFDEGVPTKYKRDSDSEFVALLKLPADVIAAYFTAVGGFFDAFRLRDSKEAAALVETLKLESVKQRYTICLSAIKAGDDDLIAKLGCDKL